MPSCQSAKGHICSASYVPSPDIAGLGVLLAFLFSAWLTLVLAVIAYWCGLVPPELLTHYDTLFSKRTSNGSRAWRATIEKMILALSDQQIITGIGVLIARYIKLDELDVRHWNIVVYLAWMSSNVHLTSLTYLRSYLSSNRKLRAFRLCGMFVLFSLLFAALFPTCDMGWNRAVYGLRYAREKPGCLLLQLPVKCFWGAPVDLGLDSSNYIDYVIYARQWVSTDGILAYLYLVIGYLWKSFQMFAPSRTTIRRFLRKIPLRLLKKALCRLAASMRYRRYRYLYIVLTSIYVWILAFYDFIDSFAASLWLVSIGLIWGTLQLWLPRQGLPEGLFKAKDSWEFGQILPLLLLGLPFIAMGETLHDEKLANKVEKKLQGEEHELGTATQQTSPGQDNYQHGQISQSTRLTITEHPVSTLFKQLDFGARYDSTSETLHSVIYQSRAFKAMLVVCNLGVVSCALPVLILVHGSATWSDVASYIYKRAIGVCISSVWLYGITASYWSRLYR